MRTLRLIAISLALTVMLTSSWSASAATSRAKKIAPKSVEMSFSATLSSIWTVLEALWTKAGCNIDPNGGSCSPAPAPTNQIDAGCNIDPDGRCRS